MTKQQILRQTLVPNGLRFDAAGRWWATCRHCGHDYPEGRKSCACGKRLPRVK
jgi:hypothetical protein